MKKFKRLTSSTIFGLLISLSLVNCSNDAIQETLTDREGNVYKTIKIGKQVWMAENLKVTHYRDGTPIGDCTEDLIWSVLKAGSYAVYNNNASNEVDTYGALYNWWAVNGDTDADGVKDKELAPEGWHVPSDAEWKELEMALGMSQSEADDTGFRGTNVGSKLAGNADLWTDGALESNSEFGTSGFRLLPGGDRDGNGDGYLRITEVASFWSATGVKDYHAWARILRYDNAGFGRASGYKCYGSSVRLIRDTDSKNSSDGNNDSSEITDFKKEGMKQADHGANYETETGEITNQSLDEDEETLDEDEIVYQDGKYYVKNSGELVTGTVASFNSKTGQKQASVQIVQGQENGVAKRWYPNGQIEELTQFKNGKKHGLEKEWHKNGQMASITEYIDGKRHGTSRDWYEDGQLESVIQYSNDMMNGTSEGWYENGQQHWTQEFKDDVVHGITKEWDEQGKLIEDIKYENGQLVE